MLLQCGYYNVKLHVAYICHLAASLLWWGWRVRLQGSSLLVLPLAMGSKEEGELGMEPGSGWLVKLSAHWWVCACATRLLAHRPMAHLPFRALAY